MELKAVRLDPSSLPYPAHLTQILMNNNRHEEARVVAERILAGAKSPQEVQFANALLQSVPQHAEWAASGRAPGTVTLPPGARTFSAGGVPGEKSDEPNSEERRFRTKEPTWRPVDVEGGVIGADCSGKPEVMITVGQEKGPLHLYAEKYKSVQM